jgi:hypothetical protein
MSKTLRRKVKAKARRKDYEYKQRLIANRPSISVPYKKPVHAQSIDRHGRVEVYQVGVKEKIMKMKTPITIMFPKSRKYEQRKQNKISKGKNRSDSRGGVRGVQAGPKKGGGILAKIFSGAKK